MNPVVLTPAPESTFAIANAEPWWFHVHRNGRVAVNWVGASMRSGPAKRHRNGKSSRERFLFLMLEGKHSAAQLRFVDRIF